MKLKGLLGCTLIAATMITMATSCKKKDDPTCHLTTVTDVATGTPTVINMTYNNDGKLSTIVSTGGSVYSKILTYSGNTIVVTDKNSSGTITGSEEVSLNNSGLAATIIQKNAGGTITGTITLQYDGNGNLMKYINGSSVTTTTFSSGDLVAFNDGTTTGTFDYYTDKSFQDGDLLKLQQMIQYGALYIVNKHLVKSRTSGSSVSNYSYEFTDGRISKLTQTSGSSVETLTYQYQCN